MLYLRSFLFNLICYGTLAFGCLVTSVVGLFNRKITIPMWNKGFIPFILWNLKHVAGIEIEIRGREYMRQENVLYASKHESALETYFKPTVFITKSTDIFFFAPLIGCSFWPCTSS